LRFGPVGVIFFFHISRPQSAEGKIKKKIKIKIKIKNQRSNAGRKSRMDVEETIIQAWLTSRTFLENFQAFSSDLR